MLALDPDPPNPISSFLKNLTLENPKEPFMLLVIDATDLDLSDIGLEGLFMTDDKPTVEEDNVLRPKPPQSHHQFSLHHLLSLTTKHV